MQSIRDACVTYLCHCRNTYKTHTMAKAFKIRRNLKKGSEYGFFQVSVSDTNSKLGETIEMVNPETHSIVMQECILWNVRGTSTRIYEGAYKERCAWVVCTDYVVMPQSDIDSDIADGRNELVFNPRLSPTWLDAEMNDVDKTQYESIVTVNKELFKL